MKAVASQGALAAVLLWVTIVAGPAGGASAQPACEPLRELHSFQIFDADADLSGCRFETVHGTAFPAVYRLDLPADEYRERRSPDFVRYERFSAQAGDWREAVSLRLSRTHQSPRSLREGGEGEVSEGLFVPAPGVIVRESGFDPRVTAHWIEPAGHYELSVNAKWTDLTIEEVAATLVWRPPVELGPYPPGTRTGIDSVDRVLAAMQAKDVPALSALIDFRMEPCGREIIGRPPSCPEGVEEGTPVEALAAGCFEPAYWTRGEESDGVLQQLADEAQHLFAVVEPEFEGQTLGYEVILAESPFGGGAWSIRVQDGQVRAIQTPCFESAPSRASQRGNPVLPIRLAPGPPVVGTGLASVQPSGGGFGWAAVFAALFAMIGLAARVRARRTRAVHR